MKVLTVNMTLNPETGGGTAVRALLLTRALRDLGVSCAIATAPDGLDGLRPQLSAVTLVTLDVIGRRFRLPVTGFGRLRRAVAEADVMLLLNHWTPINAVAYRMARAAGTPHVVSPAGALPEDGRSRVLKRWYNRLVGRDLVGRAASHIAVTADEAAQFAPYGVRPESVAVIPNGMPTLPLGDPGRFRRRFGVGETPFVLFLGRLAPIKGADLLLAAFAACAADRAAWHLVIAGPDEGQRADLAQQSRRAGLDARVHFVGFLNESEKADALAASAFAAVPSRREAMSNVVLEAAAAGRPVLVTDQCGIPDVAESGGGWVVDASAPGIEAGLRLATADVASLVPRGETWRRYASAKFSWARVGRMYLDVLTRAAGRRDVA